jgi:hypothetical protein
MDRETLRKLSLFNWLVPQQPQEEPSVDLPHGDPDRREREDRGEVCPNCGKPSLRWQWFGTPPEYAEWSEACGYVREENI